MEADRAKALEKDAADLRKKVDASGERLSRLENVETILFRVHDKVVKDPASVTADNVLKVRKIQCLRGFIFFRFA